MTKKNTIIDTQVPEAQETKAVRTPEELRQALEECTKRVRALRDLKKATAKDYNDQIQEIEVEIGNILSELEG